MTRIPFIINGLGLGNSTRCHSIIQELFIAGATISVTTSGNGLWYFDGKPEVSDLSALEPLYYSASKGKISVKKTILSLPKILNILKSTVRR